MYLYGFYCNQNTSMYISLNKCIAHITRIKMAQLQNKKLMESINKPSTNMVNDDPSGVAWKLPTNEVSCLGSKR